MVTFGKFTWERIGPHTPFVRYGGQKHSTAPWFRLPPYVWRILSHGNTFRKGVYDTRHGWVSALGVRYNMPVRWRRKRP